MITGILRGAITAALAVAVMACLALLVFARIQDPVIVAGGSMEPALPRGSLIAPAPVAAVELRSGDIVTVRGVNGVLVTHRITRAFDLAEGRFLELRGDANSGADAALVPAASVVGRVEWHLPGAGYLLGLLNTPTGLLSILALLGAGGCARWLLDDLDAAIAPHAPRGASLDVP